MKYGLIGEKLGHSYSKIIHEKLTNDSYKLLELTPEQLPSFLATPYFTGINVTIPYKEAVVPYLNEISEAASSIGAVNTIVNRNGDLHGYNTDYDGFRYLISQHQIEVRDSKVLILGSGGTSKTVQRVMSDCGAREVVVVSRTSKSYTANHITYDDLPYHLDTNIIVNTTPVGMHPNVDISPIDLSTFHAHTAIDVIYNPHRTTFLQQASDLKMKAVGGLEMLVAQAVYASQHFHNKQYDLSVIDEIYRQLLIEKLNVVLIGMPGCGKTTIAKQLGELTGKDVIDIDLMIVEREKRAITEIFAQDGEKYFRQIESQIVQEVSKRNNVIISTGGGVIKKQDNLIALRHNGIVLYIDRDINQLQINDQRPLSNNLQDNYELWKQRDPWYRKYSDYIIPNHRSMKETITNIQEVLYEITRH